MGNSGGFESEIPLRPVKFRESVLLLITERQGKPRIVGRFFSP